MSQAVAENNASSNSNNKNDSLRRIEFLFLDLLKQLCLRKPRIVLRTSEDAEQKQITYTPNRSLKLACDVYCLKQVYLLLSHDQQATKRDLYYENKMLYKSQSTLDRSVSTLCDMLNRERIFLNVLSCGKGLLQGSVSFVTRDAIGISDARHRPILLSESLIGCRIVNEAKFVLVVEKDAVFQKLVSEGFFNYFPQSILVTGKGYPDICTRQTLRWLVERLGLPIFGFFDADPHGIEIFLTYKYGSSADRAEGKNAFVRDMQWIGLFPSDNEIFPIPNNQFQPMKHVDFAKAANVKRRAQLLREPKVVHELEKLRQMRHKLELESIAVIEERFMIQGVLVPRIRMFLGQ